MRENANAVALGMISSFPKSAVIVACCFIMSFQTHAQRVILVSHGGTTQPVLVLPPSYTLDSSCAGLGAIQSGKVKKDDDDGEFNPQLEKLAAGVAAMGGNILKLNRMEDRRQSGHYRFWGDAYKTDKYNELVKRIAGGKTRKAGEIATIIIYRPSYTKGFADSLQFEIVVNDTMKLQMPPNSRYMLRVSRQGAVHLTVKHKSFVQNLSVDVKEGSDYYIRAYTNYPGADKYLRAGDMSVRVTGYTPYMEKIEDDVQGNLESSMITQVVVTKKI